MNNAVEEKPNLTVTDAALKRVAKIIDETPGKTALRISVEGGGCSGFSYQYALVGDSPGPEDIIIEGHNAKVYVDAVSLIYMGGSEVDFVDNLIRQSFQINNPNAVANCGCGTSFSV